MNLQNKLAILADAAKYDASCASSGSIRRDSKDGKGLGSTSGGMGICHSYAPDGRCISLLKILLTNFCIYDCSYCVNRSSSDIPRARFNVDELVDLTLNFYKRNYIEGLFLSSGIIQSSDYTMEQLVLVAKKLRTEHHFRGYIHLKTIPEASQDLLDQAGLYADRLSINVELPTEHALLRLAPEKNLSTITRSMSRLKQNIDDSQNDRRQGRKKTINNLSPKAKKTFLYSPAGQSTQMIVGAEPSPDFGILSKAHTLYKEFRMRRVYYSAFSPIPKASKNLPLIAPPLMREHRLYQADWLLRFYGFSLAEITTNSEGMLDLEVDPKLAWALQNREFFPININRAAKEQLLRIPGIGERGAQKIIQSRNHKFLRYDDLGKCGISLRKVAPFIETLDYSPQKQLLESQQLRSYFIQSSAQYSPQMDLFH